MIIFDLIPPDASPTITGLAVFGIAAITIMATVMIAALVVYIVEKNDLLPDEDIGIRGVDGRTGGERKNKGADQ